MLIYLKPFAFVRFACLKSPWYCWDVESGDMAYLTCAVIGLDSSGVWPHTSAFSFLPSATDRIANFRPFSSALNNWNSKRYQRLQTWQILRVRVVLEPAEALDPRRWPKGLQVWGRKLIVYGLKLQQRAPLYIALPGHLRWWKMAAIIMLIAYYIRFEFILFSIRSLTVRLCTVFISKCVLFW